MQDTNPNLYGMRPPVATQLAGLILEIDHIAIAVENLDEAIRWYSTALGFSLVERRVTNGEHSSMLSAAMAVGRTVVVLLQGTSKQSQISRFLAKFGPGVHHIAFAVADLDEAILRATEAGNMADTPIIGNEGIRQIFLQRDPVTGVRVELIERRGGSFTDQNVEHLFRALEEKDLY